MHRVWLWPLYASQKWLVDQEALKHKVMATNYDEKAKRLVVIEEKNRCGAHLSTPPHVTEGLAASH